MGRLMGIDFGLRRIGIAVTDPLQIIVQPLETIEAKKLDVFLRSYFSRETVDEIIVGHPFLESKFGDRKFQVALEEFIAKLRKDFPAIPISFQDERMSSVKAREIIQQRFPKKKDREDKALLDRMSAVIILQEYLGHI